MSQLLPAMPRASLIARGCSGGRGRRHPRPIAAVVFFAGNASPEAPGVHPSHGAHRMPASTEEE
jgi:hypothetical protein